MNDPTKVISKLKKPPAVINWVKNIRPRTDDTATSLANFALNPPHHSLQPVYNVIRQIVVDGISDEQAYKCLSKIKDEKVRAYGRQILSVLLPHIRENNWRGVEIYSGMTEYYPVGANVDVPVRPTFVINDGKKLIPYFIVGWASVGLTHYQKSILSSIISESIMTLEEFQGSECYIVCVPRYKFSKTERYVTQWEIGAHALLTKDERDSLFERYSNALGIAEKIIFERLSGN